jgi:hypothetical protein
VFQTGNNLQICNKFFEERVAFEMAARMHRMGTNREKKLHEIGAKFEDIFEKIVMPACTENGYARADYVMQQISTFESI